MRWSPAIIVSLDEIPVRDLNGAELPGLPVEAEHGTAFAWDRHFRPELSVPSETRA